MMMAASMKIHNIENDPLSHWSGYSALTFILSGILVMLLVRLTNQILPLIYGSPRMSQMTDRDRRSFVFHHVVGPIKAIVLLAGCYPAGKVVLQDGIEFETPIIEGSMVTMGDVILVVVQLFCAAYLAELHYRADTISLLSVAHHVVTILTANVAYAISVHAEDHPEAAVEIYLCIVWGVFDLIATAPLDPVLIARRLVRNTRPRLIRNCLFGTAAWSLVMLLLEIAVTGVLLYGAWHRICLAVKIITPVCFTIWTASQGHLVYLLVGMGNGQTKIIRRLSVEGDVETIGGLDRKGRVNSGSTATGRIYGSDVVPRGADSSWLVQASEVI